MKKEELRIGNYVNETGDIVSVGIDTFKNWKSLNLNSILKPIPLTEEILLKCGFKQYGDEKNTFEIYDCVINLDSVKIWICVPIKNSASSEEIKISCPEYLHQLQNLYYTLTNQEIKLI